MNRNIFPLIIVILIGFVGFFSTNANIIDLNFGEDQGKSYGKLSIDKEIASSIMWSFQSVAPVKLTIYKKSTLEFYKHFCEDIEKNFPGSNPWNIIDDFLKDSIVSEGLFKASGIYYCSEEGEYTIIIESSTLIINYHFIYDSYSINLLILSICILIITTSIAFIYYLATIFRLVKLKNHSNHPKEEEYFTDILRTDLYCSQCGNLYEPDSIYCHECGNRVK
jgi:hypothetical protein